MLCLGPNTGQSPARAATAPSQSHNSSTSLRRGRQLRDGGIIQRAQSCITPTGPPSSPISNSTSLTVKNIRHLHAAELSLSPPRRQSGEDFSRAASSGRCSTSPHKHSIHISSGSAFYSKIIKQQVEKHHVDNLARWFNMCTAFYDFFKLIKQLYLLSSPPLSVMYLSVYTYIHTYMHAFKHTCIYIYIYIHILMYL